MRIYLKVMFAVIVLVFAVLTLFTAWLLYVKLAAPSQPMVSTPNSGQSYGKEVTTDATKSWQSTGIYVQKGMVLHFDVINGSWTSWAGQAPYTQGEGSEYVCGDQIPANQCAEPVPSYPPDSLIGKIGNTNFGIGKENIILAKETGELFLRINDDENGLFDNDGVLTVRVSVKNK